MENNVDVAVQLDAEAATKRYLVRILSLDRKEEKTFCTLPVLEDTIKRANQYGCEGGKLLLACDGCELCDNEAFLYYILKGAKFMVAPSAAVWQLPEGTDSFAASVSNAGPSSQPFCLHATHVQQQRQQQQQQPQQHQQQHEQHQQQQQEPQKPQRHRTRTPQRRLHAGSDEQHPERFRSPISALPSRLAVIVAPEEKFKNVEVPWHRMPSDIREMLQAGEPLGNRINTLVQLIVNELRLVSTHIPIRVLRLIAHRLVMRYPKSFQTCAQSNTDLLSVVLNFALAMRQRNNFLNRAERNDITTIDCELSDVSDSIGGGSGGPAALWPDILIDDVDLSSSTNESSLPRY